jgi:hypothetical protein
MAKTKDKPVHTPDQKLRQIEPLAGEDCTLDELSKWSAGRWTAGQHQAAADVQKRYEALVRHHNPGREVEFHRDDETGELSFTLQKTEDELLAELEAEEKAKKDAEEAERKKEAEEAERKKRGGA